MKSADFLIVGGGAAGLTLAAELAGHSSVIVLDAEAQPGYHASGRSAAVFVPSYGTAPVRALTEMSRAFFEAPDPQFYHSPLLSPRGLLRVALPGGEVEHDEIISGLAGIERLSPEAAVGFFPLLDKDRIAAASFERDVYDIDADALLQGAARSARSKGAELVFGMNVTRLTRRNSAWSVDTDKGSFEAGTLVNAAGAWSNDIAQMADLAPLDLVPSRRSVAILPMPAELDAGNRTPFTVTAPLRWYAKVEAGRLLISPADQDPVSPHDAFADDMVLAEGLQRFSEDTGFEVSRLEGSWAGLRTMTPDENPVIGFDPDGEAFFWLAGQCGFGIQCAPGIARFAKSLLEGIEEQAELRSPFSVDRLRSGR